MKDIAKDCLTVLSHCAASQRGDWLDYISMQCSYEAFVQGAMARALNANLYVYQRRNANGDLISGLGFPIAKTGDGSFGLKPEWKKRDFAFGSDETIEFVIELKATARWGIVPVHANVATIQDQLDGVLAKEGEVAVDQIVRAGPAGLALVCHHMEVAESPRPAARWQTLAANAHRAATAAVTAWATRKGCEILDPVVVGLPSSREAHHWERNTDGWLARADDLLVLLAVYVPPRDDDKNGPGAA